MTPSYRLSISDQPIHERLESLTITDYAGSQADTLLLCLNGEGLKKPSLDVEISIEIGYAETTTWDAGTFIVQEIRRIVDAEHGNRLKIKGISMPQGPGKALQTTGEERTWQDKTFGDIASDIINGAGLTPKIDSALAGIKMPTITQRNYSDAALLHALAKERNAFVKYHGDTVIVMPYDSGELGTITITQQQITRCTFLEEQRDSIKKVTAKYLDINTGKTEKVTAGSGRGGSLILDYQFPDEATATQAAEARLKAAQRNVQVLSVQLPTLPGLFAEKTIKLTDFDDAELNQSYTARAVTTTLDQNGLQSRLSLQSIPS